MSGLPNLGQTCYLSCVVHLLINPESNRKLFRLHVVTEASREGHPKSCLVCLLNELGNLMTRPTTKPVPIDVVRRFAAAISINTRQSMDIREVYSELIHCSLPELRVEYNISMDQSILCSKCGNESTTQQSTHYLTNDSCETSITACVEIFDKGEILRDYKCNSCLKVALNTKATNITSKTNHFVIYQQEHKAVVVPEEITIQRHTYLLDALVLYYPDPYRHPKDDDPSAHYVSCRRVNGKLLRFDDASTTIFVRHENDPLPVSMVVYRHASRTTGCHIDGLKLDKILPHVDTGKFMQESLSLRTGSGSTSSGRTSRSRKQSNPRARSDYSLSDIPKNDKLSDKKRSTSGSKRSDGSKGSRRRGRQPPTQVPLPTVDDTGFAVKPTRTRGKRQHRKVDELLPLFGPPVDDLQQPTTVFPGMETDLGQESSLVVGGQSMVTQSTNIVELQPDHADIFAKAGANVEMSVGNQSACDSIKITKVHSQGRLAVDLSPQAKDSLIVRALYVHGPGPKETRIKPFSRCDLRILNETLECDIDESINRLKLMAQNLKDAYKLSKVGKKNEPLIDKKAIGQGVMSSKSALQSKSSDENQGQRPDLGKSPTNDEQTKMFQQDKSPGRGSNVGLSDRDYDKAVMQAVSDKARLSLRRLAIDAERGTLTEAEEKSLRKAGLLPARSRQRQRANTSLDKETPTERPKATLGRKRSRKEDSTIDKPRRVTSRSTTKPAAQKESKRRRRGKVEKEHLDGDDNDEEDVDADDFEPFDAEAEDEDYEEEVDDDEDEEDDEDEDDDEDEGDNIPLSSLRKGAPPKRSYAKRKDGVKKPKAGRHYWGGRTISGAHFSHCAVGGSVIKSQKVPGFCKMCPKSIYLSFDSEVKRHYRATHMKQFYVIRGTRILACKCSVRVNQGDESITRNMHFHCVNCHWPFGRIANLRRHKLSKHGESMKGFKGYTEGDMKDMYGPRESTHEVIIKSNKRPRRK